jgi:hypothetical protein
LCFRRDNSPDICVTPDEQHWREKLGIPSQTTPRLQVRYLGVWDTVGALGIPSRFAIAGPLDKKFEFHDTSLSAFALSARHAVAIDERRKDFVPTLWDNTDSLNAERGIDPTAPDAPYQQRWFPGVHSSVGWRWGTTRAFGSIARLGIRRGTIGRIGIGSAEFLAHIRVEAGLHGVHRKLLRAEPLLSDREQIGRSGSVAGTSSNSRGKHECTSTVAGGSEEPKGRRQIPTTYIRSS